MELDPLLLARIQFAFTISFHILFPSFTIGLASFLAVLEGQWLRTGNDTYIRLYRFWVKLFAVSFGMGVVSGIVMSYQFGTNWSRFSDASGNVLGPLLGYEVLTAFFLEATFLGIMLFGAGRVSRGLHFFSTCAVAVGTLVSTFWIMSANSWMQTPAGHELRDGIFYAVDWWAVVFNPSFPIRLAHMVAAAYLTTCFVIGGVAAWYLLRGRHIAESRIMLGMAVGFAAIFAPLQVVIGDMTGLKMLEHQPAKVAAMEGHWETGRGVPFILFGWPDQAREETRFAVEIPYATSLVLTHELDGEVRGLKDWPADERPPVAIVFWSFRVMLAVGFAMMFAGLYGLWLLWRRRLYDTRWFKRFWMLMTPSGFVAVLAGWFVAEVGRQPYIIYGLMRTADASSPVPGTSIGFSLALFVVAYFAIFGAGTWYMLRMISIGPATPMPEDQARPGPGTPMRPLSHPTERIEPAE